MNATIDVIDLFAGPGGWSQACRALGLREVGIELDPWACATRAAAGHLTVRADVAAFPVRQLARRGERPARRGLLGSPPCGTFSAAGLKAGIGDMALLHQALDELAAGRDPRAELAAACSDPRTPLVVEPLRFALAIRPEWIALEQVPAVLPLWEHIARILRGLGYSAWCGILNAANFGVPQTRQRAILIASRVRTVAPPEPTHAKTPEPDTLFGPGRRRWVSMAEALGWLPAGVVNTRGERKTPGGNEFSSDQPSWALTEKARSWTLRLDPGAGGFAEGWGRNEDEPSPTVRLQSQSWVLKHNDRANATVRSIDEPAGTLAFGHAQNEYCWILGVAEGESSGGWALRNNTQANAAARSLDEPAGTLFFGSRCTHETSLQREPKNNVPGAEPRSESVHITIEEAAVLQSFPADYPWQGTKTQRFLQCGNAVPPRLAAAVIGAATGLDWHAAVEREYGHVGQVAA